MSVGSDAGGERMTAIYGVIETAELSRSNAEAYPRCVIDCAADHLVKRIAELLPENFHDIHTGLDRRLAA